MKSFNEFVQCRDVNEAIAFKPVHCKIEIDGTPGQSYVAKIVELDGNRNIEGYLKEFGVISAATASTGHEAIAKLSQNMMNAGMLD